MKYNRGTCKKWQLSCCALAQLTANDNTPKRDIENMLQDLKRDALDVWQPKNCHSGERAAFVIVTPTEPNLERTVQELGFKQIAQFDRRNGYNPIGKLKMYFLNW